MFEAFEKHTTQSILDHNDFIMRKIEGLGSGRFSAATSAAPNKPIDEDALNSFHDDLAPDIEEETRDADGAICDRTTCAHGPKRDTSKPRRTAECTITQFLEMSRLTKIRIPYLCAEPDKLLCLRHSTDVELVHLIHDLRQKPEAAGRLIIQH